MNRWFPVVGAAAALMILECGHAQSPAVAATVADVPGTAERCARLGRLRLPELVMLDAQAMAPGPFELPAFGPFPARTAQLPAFCRVLGRVEPAVDFEVWLPYSAEWNGRFLAVGGGGLAGTISYAAMADALLGGYATASTDTGHDADDIEWLEDPRRLRDYGYRAIYEMTAKSKATIAAFYGRAADFNYFNGCSTGGRQGLMEAQRFPADYDGIVAGAPVNHFVGTAVTQVWVARATQPVADSPNLSAADLARVNDAVLARCDTADGVTDGVLADPPACAFDPGVLQCSTTSAGQCLDPGQVESIRRIYAGPSDPVTGQRLHPGFAKGGETSWQLATTPGLMSIAAAYFSRSVFGDPAWDWRTFDFALDVEQARDQTGPILDATDSDLSSFREDGGKLIVYHGWNDQLIVPEASIDYYEAVAATLAAQGPGRESIADFFRLFMVPGMTHCAGGPGADRFDAQMAIENWVERNVAPERIEASHIDANGRTTFTRPLCPYPQRPRYRGNGNVNSAESFVCVR